MPQRDDRRRALSNFRVSLLLRTKPPFLALFCFFFAFPRFFFGGRRRIGAKCEVRSGRGEGWGARCEMGGARGRAANPGTSGRPSPPTRQKAPPPPSFAREGRRLAVRPRPGWLTTRIFPSHRQATCLTIGLFWASRQAICLTIGFFWASRQATLLDDRAFWGQSSSTAVPGYLWGRGRRRCVPAVAVCPPALPRTTSPPSAPGLG